MFKFLGNKLFGAKKQDSQKPKHRLTVSIPSTKYDPPSKHSKHSKTSSSSTSHSNISSISTHSISKLDRSKSSKSSKSSTKYKPKPKSKKKSQHKSKSQLSKQIQTLNKNGKPIFVKAASSSALTSPFRAPPNDPTRPIFQRSAIFHANSSLKFEITIQYQQQMWTVYKTLCDFIELHNKLKTKYGLHTNPPMLSTENDELSTTQESAASAATVNTKDNNAMDKIEVPPLLPLGLFYLYFQNDTALKSETNGVHGERKKNGTNKGGKKYSPKHVYKQIYQYHQQQIMIQKRQEAQLMQQMKQIQHIRQIQHEQQLLLQQRQMQQLKQSNTSPTSTNTNTNNNNQPQPPHIKVNSTQSPALKPQPMPFGAVSTSLPLQQHQSPKITPLTMNKSVPMSNGMQQTQTAPVTMNGTKYDQIQFPPPNHPRMNRSVFDAESPFLKHMRVSLQIWLRVIVDDPILMISPELSSFIQFRWIYKKDKAKSEGHKKSKSKQIDRMKSSTIIGGVHAPDAQSYFDKIHHKKDSKNGKLSRFKARTAGNFEDIDFNIMNSIQDNDGSDNDINRPTLSDFTLLKVVGKGAFGKVLQVRKVDDGNIYAMKILKKENVIKRNQIEHTKTERRVLGYVKHPFIVSLYYAFQTETKLFLVLDYCGGGELFFHLGKAGRFKEDRARFYAASIALALEYLHSKNIIYRDLKPENVLLDNEGHIKLTDFGLSKENITDSQLAHSFCGTPEYLAPEILRRCGHGKPADWWSLGALLYEMLTGMPPFYSRDRDRLFEKILHSKLRFPNYFSDPAVNILTLLMQRNWKKRLGSYQSSNPAKYNNDPKKKSFAQLKGAQQIKRHIFFKTIDWKLLYERKLKPPFIPKLNDDQTNNFDPEFTEMAIYSMDANERSSRYIHREKRKYLLKFESFTYVRDENLLNNQDSEDSENDDESTSNSNSSDTESEIENDAQNEGNGQIINEEKKQEEIKVITNPNDQGQESSDSEQSNSEINVNNDNDIDNDNGKDDVDGNGDGDDGEDEFEVFQ